MMRDIWGIMGCWVLSVKHLNASEGRRTRDDRLEMTVVQPLLEFLICTESADVVGKSWPGYDVGFLAWYRLVSCRAVC